MLRVNLPHDPARTEDRGAPSALPPPTGSPLEEGRCLALGKFFIKHTIFLYIKIQGCLIKTHTINFK